MVRAFGAHGQSRRFDDVRATSALPLTADVRCEDQYVRKVPEATLQARLEAEVGHMGPLPPYGHRLAGCFLVLYLIKVVKNPF